MRVINQFGKLNLSHSSSSDESLLIIAMNWSRLMQVAHHYCHELVKIKAAICMSHHPS